MDILVDWSKILKENFTFFVEQTNLTKEEFAEFFEISLEEADKYLNFEKQLTIPMLADLCSVFGLNLNWLLADIGEMYHEIYLEELLAEE